MEADFRWAVVDSSHFDHRQWGDELVLYVVATGETHALGVAHSASMALLMEHPGMARTAAQWLALMTDEDPSEVNQPLPQDSADLVVLDGALADLRRLGVVERLPV